MQALRLVGQQFPVLRVPRWSTQARMEPNKPTWKGNGGKHFPAVNLTPGAAVDRRPQA